MSTEIDGVGLLRSLARELDDEADTAGSKCACPTHLVTRMVLADLAATYRTRALRYLAANPPAPEPDPRIHEVQNVLYEQLERAARWRGALRQEGYGPMDMRSVLSIIDGIVGAHHRLKALVRR